MKIAIIGGGISAFAAAISAAKNNDVTILEKNSKVLKKLLLTGNGKCNYFNTDQDISHYHTNSDIDIKEIVNSENIAKVKTFWAYLGIVPFIKNGYYYPYSETASSMKEALVFKAKYSGVHIITDCDITNIVKVNDKFHITSDNYQATFDKVIIATGSYAYPITGSTGFGYDVAKSFGHTINNVNPSLVQLVTNLGIEAKWNGVRHHAIITDLNTKKCEEGEIQLTSFGISGICVFNLSRDIAIGLNKSIKESVSINFAPWCNDMLDFLNKRSKNFPKRNIMSLCESFINYKLLSAILKFLKISEDSTWDELNTQGQEKLAEALTDFQIEIVGTKDYNSSQVCSGGLNLAEINLNTLESKKVPNLYFCGEVLDLDGDCGGYNITIAILTGILAGESC